MLDQNTSTIIASIIAVLGTLGGAIIGVLLSNRQTLKLEKLRTEQEKLKRKTEKIEEAYTTLREFEETSHQILTDIGIGHVDTLDFVEKSKQLYNMLNRLSTLIAFYAFPLKADMNQLKDDFTEYWIQTEELYYEKKNTKRKDLVNGWDNSKLDAAREKYNETWSKFEESLVRMVQ
jgi:hypothetical protein